MKCVFLSLFYFNLAISKQKNAKFHFPHLNKELKPTTQHSPTKKGYRRQIQPKNRTAQKKDLYK